MQVIEAVKQSKIIAIVRGIESGKLAQLVSALHAGGISFVEVTFDQSRPDSWQDTARAIGQIAKDFAGRVVPGAGTVVTLEQLALAADAGAQYIISPNTDAAVIGQTKALGLVSMPGAFTPTEIVHAHNAGADFVKVFPVGAMGAGYIKALKAPLPHIPLMAVGGVTEQNAASFLAAGAEGLGVGGNLVNKQWIEAGEFDKIQAAAEAYVAAIKG